MPKPVENTTPQPSEVDPQVLSELIEAQLEEVAGGGYDQLMGTHLDG